jgi:hypothetical protein
MDIGFPAFDDDHRLGENATHPLARPAAASRVAGYFGMMARVTAAAAEY